ncbi:PREDICTED: uncharacterized protein LOC103341044 [Prunus mume]|uniref:Uncharacterized protein LOC103341044 n=1 Tax=Prunus mume TaxID=102107 RepID=A0ABM0PPZ0_PRUMU|nr:PREDICTED: uncharacterized protein LOC103341044 [Prunus mume]
MKKSGNLEISTFSQGKDLNPGTLPYNTSINSHTLFLNTPQESLTLSMSMTSMKEPPLSRRKRPTSQPKKLKLVCSFNGAFQPRPPSGKLRYVGGEARIVSVDRNIGFSKLRSKILDLCPNINPSFTLKYQLPGSGSDSETSPLVLIVSDDDVRCMIDEYDKLELDGKSARLWVFVCSNGNDNLNVQVNCVKGVKFSDGFESESPNIETHHLGGAPIDNKVAVKNPGAVRYGDESLRKMVLKQQLLAKQSALGRGFGVNESDMEMGCFGESQKCASYERPPIDLGPEQQVSINRDLLANRVGSNWGNNQVQFSVSRSSLLNPRYGNLHVETDSSGQCCSARSGQVFCNGVGMYSQSVPATQCSKPMNCSSGMKPTCNCCNAKKDLGNSGVAGISYLNRENVKPWEANCYSVKDQLSCHYSGDALAGTVYPVKSSYAGDKVCGGFNSSIRNHRFGVNDSRIQRCYQYHVRNHHRNNIVEMGNNRTKQGISVRKCYPGLRPNSNIAKQGQPMRAHNLNSWKHCYGFSEQTMEERVRMMDSNSVKDSYLMDVLRGNEKPSKWGGPALSQHRTPSPEESLLGCYGAFTGVVDQLLLNPDATESSCPSVRRMDILEDLLTGSDFGNCEGPYRTSYENFDAVPVNCDLEKEVRQMDSQKVADTSGLPSEVGRGVGIRLEGDSKLPNGEAVINSVINCENGTNGSYSGVTSSVSISLHNLSLSSSKEAVAPQLSSHASSVVRIDGKANNGESLECFKVIGGNSSDPAAFYTHLASRELQTIKNSDLEFIKELGSGTYGTVYYGKWKGSDVAIKKIKPSCFTEGTVKEDRLLADFWKEAHILGQLHHPNIVAFYGVVSDGPVINLATVTEYMVNGSLKQVLQKKDRTIDRRKRLIIAMDAAFGMEYLHEKSIVHFDLKSHNFLVNMRDPQRPVCKIGDLGLSKIKQRTLVSGGVRGTIPWMAPELLNSKNNLVTEKVDVYSFGIVMWELLTGEEPYANLRSKELIAGIIKGSLRPEIPSWCDPLWRSLMERCWSSDPDSRPPFSEIAKELRAMSAAMNIK